METVKLEIFFKVLRTDEMLLYSTIINCHLPNENYSNIGDFIWFILNNLDALREP